MNKTAFLTPPQLANRWRISVAKVLTWIRSGELRAFDMSTKPGGRPRYRIYEEDVQRFERSREARPDVERTPAIQRNEVKQFI